MPKQEKAFTGSFDEALKAFAKANDNSLKFARICSRMALSHFSEHGDLSYVQRFFDTMIANYNRRAAYTAWMIKFAPVVLDKMKWSKDKTAEGFGKGTPESHVLTDEQLAAAFKVDFWEFAPEAPIVVITALDFDKALLAFIQRWAKESKNRKIDMPTTKDHIHDIEEVVKSRLSPEALADFEEDEARVTVGEAPADQQPLH